MHRSTACAFAGLVFTCWLASSSAQSTDNVTESTTPNVNASTIVNDAETSTSPEENRDNNVTTPATTDATSNLTHSFVTTETTTSWTGLTTGSSSASTSTSTARPNPTTTNSTRNCPSLTPADVDIGEIQGTWYIQAYTGPTDGGQITECDVFDITIDRARNTGSIVYNFIRKGFRQPSVEVANITLLPHAGQFFYNVTGVDLSMTTTILVFRRNEAYVHLACPKDLSKQPTLVIATKCRTEPKSVVAKLLNEAAQHGSTAGVRLVDNTDCPAN